MVVEQHQADRQAQSETPEPEELVAPSTVEPVA